MEKETIAKICEYILEGMTEREACILADYSYPEFQLKLEQSELLRTTIEKVKVEFKRTHIKEIQKHKSEKNSMYILEKLRPDEFGGKAKGGENTTINIIGTLIKEIQNDNSGIATVTTRGSRASESGTDQDGPSRILTIAEVLK